ncbi:MAG: hypothetical protein JWL86_627 [Rhizobium sp.]|nr:hypothetical protein [Rhizobium sp.]
MGYDRHECIVISGWSSAEVLRAHEAAVSIFNPIGMGGLVGGLTQHAINGGAAFLVAPDGSKEGWADSDKGEAARSEFIEFLRSKEAPHIEWALILIGGDDGEYRVLQSPNDTPEAA